MIKFDFSSRTVLVTGGTRGIGAAISSAFLQAGAEVLASYASNAEAAAEFKDKLGPLADKLHTFSFDVSDYQQAETFFSTFDQNHSKLDILINSAGIRQDGVVAMLPENAWRRVLDVNLTGSFNMAKLGLLRMLPQKYGRIIMLGSPVGRIGFAGQANYAASKAGLEALCKSLSKEVARRNITVNCISPGFIDTDFISALTAEQVQEYRNMVPMKRFGKASEVANAVLFLASEESQYITGTVLELAGGL